MICDMCGKKGARLHRVTRSFGRGRTTFLIQGVPLVTCPACGESYPTAEILQGIARLPLHRRELSVDKKIRVAECGRPA